MSESRTIMERLGEACVSSDLRHKPTLCDVDFVGALGMAGVHQKQGSALLDLDLTLDAGAVRDALAAARQIARNLGLRRRWNVSGGRMERIAREAMRAYLHPACPSCKGRAFVGVESAKEGRWQVCSCCKGEGRRKIRTESGREKIAPCSACAGMGRIWKPPEAVVTHPRPCPTCSGSGLRQVPREIGEEVRAVAAVMDARRASAEAGVRRVMRWRERV